jgi:hypothetical protein
MVREKISISPDAENVRLARRLVEAGRFESLTAAYEYGMYLVQCMDPAFREIERKRLEEEYRQRMSVLDNLDLVVGRPKDVSPEDLARICPDGTDEQVLEWSLSKAPALTKHGVSVSEFVERQAKVADARREHESLRTLTRSVMTAALEVVSGRSTDRDKYATSIRRNLEALRASQPDYMASLEALIERRYPHEGAKMLDLIKQVDSDLNIKSPQEFAQVVQIPD